MATITKRGKKYQAKVRRRGHPCQTETFDTRAKALAWSRMIESEMDRGVFQSRALAEQTTFGEILARYLEAETPKKEGAEAESYLIKALLRDPISQYSMSKLTTPVLAVYRNRRLKSVGSGTVNRELNLISAVISVAMAEYEISLPENPVSKLRRPKNPNPVKRRISPEEMELLLSELEAVERDSRGRFQKGTRNPWLKPFFILAIETGARRSDLLRLEWDMIDLSRQIADLDKSKNGEGRVIALSKTAVRELAKLPRQDHRVFPLTKDAVKCAWRRVKKRLNLKIRFHDTRHEATSRLFEKGLNHVEVASITGHKDLRSLRRYTHTDAERIAQKLG